MGGNTADYLNYWVRYPPLIKIRVIRNMGRLRYINLFELTDLLWSGSQQATYDAPFTRGRKTARCTGGSLSKFF